MNATKDQLITFIEEKVLFPVENNPASTETIRRKVRATRMRLNNQVSAEKVEDFFWSAMATDRGIDSYTQIHKIGGPTFEDVREEFQDSMWKKLTQKTGEPIEPSKNDKYN